MEDDYYKVLGVGRSASENDIQKAYRALARKYHPDLASNPTVAKEKFQAVQAAYDVLSDPEKRKMYDKFGSGFEQMGQRGGNPFAGYGDGSQEFDFGNMFSGQAGGGGFEDILRQFAGAGAHSGGQRASATPRKGQDLEQEATVPFNTAILGGKIVIPVRHRGVAESVTVTIPAGIEEGKKIRLKGQGYPSPNRGPDGDLLVKVSVAKHPSFERRGMNLVVRVPVSFFEAWQGGKIEVPTPYGTATLTVPAGASSGTKLRLKEHGIRPKNGEPGDLIVEVTVRLPDGDLSAAASQIEEIAKQFPMPDVRKELQW